MRIDLRLLVGSISLLQTTNTQHGSIAFRDEKLVDELPEMPNSRKVVPPQVVDATPSELKALIRGGVYDRTEAKRAFCGAESGALETLEGRPVAT
jgi:hypothetical protein